MAKTFDLSGLTRTLASVRAWPRQVEQAMRRAKATVKRRVPVQARREIEKDYALAARRIAAGLSVRDGSGGAIELIGAKRGINAIEFDAKWGGPRSEGVRFKVKAGRVSLQRGGFIASGRSANRLVFERAVRGGRVVPRFPIQGVYGPSVAQMLRRPGRSDRIGEFARTVLSEEIARLFR